VSHAVFEYAYRLAQQEVCLAVEKGRQVMYQYTAMVKAMLIDPKKVARCALGYAVAVVAMFLILEVAVTDAPKKEPDRPGVGGVMEGRGPLAGGPRDFRDREADHPVARRRISNSR
jgi:hypothetical protein